MSKLVSERGRNAECPRPISQHSMSNWNSDSLFRIERWALSVESFAFADAIEFATAPTCWHDLPGLDLAGSMDCLWALD